MHRSIPASVLPKIEDAIRRGEMIEAIKLHRDATDSSFAEAKDAVDAMAAELLGVPLERQAPRVHRTGCLTVVVAVAAVGGTLLVAICR